MYSKKQLEQIFSRIGLVYDPEEKADFALLSKVQYAFQKTIPYENIDILNGIPISIEYDDIFDKIVMHHRGGYCFEINGLLSETYRSLGFDAKDCFARYLRGEEGIPMRRHRVALVTIDGLKYVSDAGCGQAAYRIPLLLEEGAVSEQYGETYKPVRDPFLGWVIKDIHHGEWKDFYSFTEEPQITVDFYTTSFWCQYAPDSPFTKVINLSIKTDTGRYTLDDRTFRCFDGDKVDERVIENSELDSIIGRYFGLDVSVGKCGK